MEDESVLRARDVMEKNVITVSPDTPILDVHRLFVEEEIHGAPVVDEEGRVRGVISSLDLLRVIREVLEPDDLGDRPRAHALTAADCMTRELVIVGPDATVPDLAQTMRTQRVHRVLVGSNGMLDGVITTFDLLRVITGETA